MTPADIAQALIGLAAVIAVVGIATFGAVVRLSVKWGQLDERVKSLGAEHVAMRNEYTGKDADIMAEVREDRKANNERFNRVENRVLFGGRNSGGPSSQGNATGVV